MRRLLEMRANFSIFVHMDRGEIIIYQTADGETRLDVRMENDSVWLTQAQIAQLFDASIYTPLIIRIFLLNRYNLCFDKYTECRDNANRCISQLCIYVLYRLLSVLLWNVRYQIQRVER